MTEKNLYDRDGLFHNITKQSTVMAGRYVVLPNGANDLNAGNILSGIELPQAKYPLVACLPPTSDIVSGFEKWEYFICRLLFLDTTAADGTGQMTSRSQATNTSGRSAQAIWQSMKECAFAFLSALEAMQDKTRNQFIIDSSTPYRFARVSNREKDLVSGLMVQIKVGVFHACSFADIPENKYDQIVIPNML